MRERSSEFIVDVGNSYIKIAEIKEGNITLFKRILATELDDLIDIIRNKKIILSNVANKAISSEIKTNCNLLFELNRNVNFPFNSAYKTMDTWGMDRACNIAAGQLLFPHKNVLVVDIGTCIKFDFLSALSEYEGGSISPGINLRFQSLYSETARLPMIEPNINFSLIGKSTTESINSGVMKGCYCEISKMIECYEEIYPNLTVIITGGDSKYFEFPDKSNIFAEENLTLMGLYHLYQYNAG